jgi:hypothetical protein
MSEYCYKYIKRYDISDISVFHPSMRTEDKNTFTIMASDDDPTTISNTNVINVEDQQLLRDSSPSPPGVGTVLSLSQPQQPYELEDDHSGSGDLRAYNGVFEGPEKTLGKNLLIILFVLHHIMSI